MSATLRRYCSEEDVLQETLCRAWFHRTKFQGSGEGNAFAWLWGIAHRVLLEWGRQASRRRLGLAHDLEDGWENGRVEPSLAARVTRASQRALKLECVQRMLVILDHLDPDDAEVVLMHEYDQLPHAAVAERLGIGEAAARKRLERARQRLEKVRRRLEAEHGPVALPHELED